MTAIATIVAPGVAVAAGLVLAACAAAPIDPGKNSINTTLNQGSSVVTGSIARMNRANVQALAETLPVCIAYQLPATEPALNVTFRSVMADVTTALRKRGAQRIAITVHHAQKKGGIDPLPELVAMKTSMPAPYHASRMGFEPMSPPEFRRNAKCPGNKDTVLVVGDETLFYRNELPLATLGAGEMRIDSILFLKLSDAGGEATAAVATMAGSQQEPQ